MEETIRVSIEGIEDAEVRRSATTRAREAAVLELYRLGKITSGKAAEEIGIGRVEFLDLASSRGISTLQLTPEELVLESESFEP